MAKHVELRDDEPMGNLDRVLNLVVGVLELATLFAICVWGFEQNVFVGIAAPAAVGLLWHRGITSRLPGPAVH